MKRTAVSIVREWSAVKFMNMTEPVVVFCHKRPIAVVMPYTEYQRIQTQLLALEAFLTAEPGTIEGAAARL